MKVGGKILAVDAGLTACKALVFSSAGEVLGEAKQVTPVNTGGDGGSVMDMSELWKVACAVISEAIASGKITPSDISCAGFSGHGNGLYCIDKNGLPTGSAITSMDTRSESEIDNLTESQISSLERKTMQHLWAGQPGIILRRMKKEDPEQYRKIHKIMFCKDYLAFKLTGKVATDYSDVSASGLLDNSNGIYDPEILNCLEIPEIRDALPEIVKGYDVRGRVSIQGADDTGLSEGLPVIGGMFDVDACVYGTGVTSLGEVCSIAGTWNINAAVSDEMFFHPEIRQCIRRMDGKTALMIDSSATSSVNIEWYLKKVLGVKDQYSFFDACLESEEFNLGNPYFIPFINGSLTGAPLKGAFTGLDMTCDREKLFAAVYEGICFAHRRHLENLEKSGAEIDTLRITGGAARGPMFCRLFADIIGKNVEAINFSQSGALGLWAAAAVSLGNYDNMESALKGKLNVEKTYLPDSARHELFSKRYNKFNELIKYRL